MRWSQSFIPTLKEIPAEAEILSHKLLLRAGLVRKLTGGLYTFLPIGFRVLRKIEEIIREEMNSVGALEVLMPALQPTELWQQSGRYETASDVLYRAKDRSNKEWVLSPTAEEVITTLAAGEISSYRQMPLSFYQVSVKFRDEIRPRFGLMRAKEFIMKDAYSFDCSDEAATITYQKMFGAYQRIFDRCGLKNFPVEADTGVIGGSHSHEFMVPAETGENDVVYCNSGHYAANLEKARSTGPLEPAPKSDNGNAPEKFYTPGVTTIEGLMASPFNVSGAQQIKTLVFMVKLPGGDTTKTVVALLRGDDQLNEAKFAGLLGSTIFRPATVDEIFSILGAHPGSLGAVTSTLSASGLTLTVLADEALRGARGMTTGANEDGFHLRHVNMDRDVLVTQWGDLRTVKVGELCISTGKPLKIQRAIEVGHVFKLGTKYSEKFGARFLDAEGKSQLCVMGCYGIGVTRTLQAIIEQSNDKDGIVWPLSVAPYAVCITPLSVLQGSAVMLTAERLYTELTAAGVEVILDDRDERPGVKFKDADLVGFPIRLGIGEKSLAKGEVELKPRGGTLQAVKVEDAVQQVMAVIAAKAV